jgi:hypothetical protein
MKSYLEIPRLVDLKGERFFVIMGLLSKNLSLSLYSLL